MKKIVLGLSLLVGLLACHTVKKTTDSNLESNEATIKKVNDKIEETEVNTDKTNIEWLDFETAIERNKKDKKFIFIDVYTNWCGWCKKMDATTFVNPEVVNYMNTHFYAVKMDAESKTPIAYKDKLHEYQNYGNRGYNTLAVSLLDSQMSFPSFVVLNNKEIKVGKIIGYKTPEILLTELKKYVGK